MSSDRFALWIACMIGLFCVVTIVALEFYPLNLGDGAMETDEPIASFSLTASDVHSKPMPVQRVAFDDVVVTQDMILSGDVLVKKQLKDGESVAVREVFTDGATYLFYSTGNILFD